MTTKGMQNGVNDNKDSSASIASVKLRLLGHVVRFALLSGQYPKWQSRCWRRAADRGIWRQSPVESVN